MREICDIDVDSALIAIEEIEEATNLPLGCGKD